MKYCAKGFPTQYAWSAFAREAPYRAPEELRRLELEKKHREGYRRKPVRGDEFAAVRF